MQRRLSVNSQSVSRNASLSHLSNSNNHLTSDNVQNISSSTSTCQVLNCSKSVKFDPQVVIDINERKAEVIALHKRAENLEAHNGLNIELLATMLTKFAAQHVQLGDTNYTQQ
ncbi:Hypothetical_protein [Hexamita inflata]|uniref:Hypothetical_protein n=1 Tax=Hexamita inflata TaxID=28002 RepID=A0AA86TQF9_9EUKA|nr:Hypothetical protein HINF_LOCUS12165 [Hexamita inflata]